MKDWIKQEEKIIQKLIGNKQMEKDDGKLCFS